MATERKYLAHLIDAAFDMTHTKTNYIRIGKDLEDFTMNMAPEVDSKRNILGENAVYVSGYDASGSVDPFYYEYNDELSEKIWDLAMSRATGDACRTSYVDVLLAPPEEVGGKPTVIEAWREDCMVLRESYGGDSTGIQMPFEIRPVGNRVKGTFDMDTKKFTESENL